MFAFLAPILNSVFGQAFASFVDAYKAKLASENTADQIAAGLAAKELEVERRQAELNTQVIISEEGRWWTSLPRSLVQWSFALFVVKSVIWDTVLGWGSTPALHGDIQVWAGWVMTMWFGGRTIEKVARIIKR